MGCLLVCDLVLPACYQTIQATVANKRVGAPQGWIMMIDKSEQIIVACCQEHFDLILKHRGG